MTMRNSDDNTCSYIFIYIYKIHKYYIYKCYIHIYVPNPYILLWHFRGLLEIFGLFLDNRYVLLFQYNYCILEFYIFNQILTLCTYLHHHRPSFCSLITFVWEALYLMGTILLISFYFSKLVCGLVKVTLIQILFFP